MGHSTCSASLLLRCRGEEPKGNPVAWKRSKEKGQHGGEGVLTGGTLGDMYMEVLASIIAVGTLSGGPVFCPAHTYNPPTSQCKWTMACMSKGGNSPLSSGMKEIAC